MVVQTVNLMTDVRTYLWACYYALDLVQLQVIE